MVNRLPGFGLDEGDDVRGFAGAGGNVLIDGVRPASKTDTLENQLARIPAAQVERIEVIRGGAPGIDMQGRSLVANIVRRRADTLQQTLIGRLEWFTEDGRVLPGWRYELTRQAGRRTLDFSMGRLISYDDSTGLGFRTRRDPAGQLFLRETVGNENDGWGHFGRAEFKTPLLDGTLRLNGSLTENDFKPEAHFSGTFGRLDVTDNEGGVEAELGGNYTRELGARWSMELVGLEKRATSDYLSESKGYENERFFAEDETGERIGRAVLKHRRTDALSFEAGGEVAFNFLEGTVELTVDDATVPLPFNDVRGEEDRNEIFALANWRPFTGLTLEGGVRYETSTIRQIGDGAQERSFEYLKPRLLATWTPDPRHTVRFRAERELGQLDFGDFISTANLTTGVVAAGNPDLEPDKTWVYELTGERRFWDTGSVVATLRHEQITDVSDRVPIEVLNDDGSIDVFEAPGNIGEGTNDELEVDVTLPLKRLGVEGGELKADLTWRKSEVTDPTTGENRRISGQRPDVLEVTYRHDLPARNLVFNFTWFDGWRETYYNFDQVNRFHIPQFAEASVEYKPRSDTSITFFLANLGRFEFDRRREVYEGRRDEAPLEFVENRSNRSQVRAILRVRRTLGA